MLAISRDIDIGHWTQLNTKKRYGKSILSAYYQEESPVSEWLVRSLKVL